MYYNRIFDFAVGLSSAARLFTLEQIARHPDLSWRTQPRKRASEVLLEFKYAFEKIPGPIGEPFRFRLSSLERRRRHVTYKTIDPMSQKVYHWLGLGDIWSALTFAGGRPDEWVTEPSHQFDVSFQWHSKHYLLEYQRTPLTQKMWQQKWDRRLEWYKYREWNVKPIVVLVTEHYQEPDTMCIPRAVIHAKSIDELPRLLNKF